MLVKDGCCFSLNNSFQYSLDTFLLLRHVKKLDVECQRSQGTKDGLQSFCSEWLGRWVSMDKNRSVRGAGLLEGEGLNVQFRTCPRNSRAVSSSCPLRLVGLGDAVVRRGRVESAKARLSIYTSLYGRRTFPNVSDWFGMVSTIQNCVYLFRFRVHWRCNLTLKGQTWLFRLTGLLTVSLPTITTNLLISCQSVQYDSYPLVSTGLELWPIFLNLVCYAIFPERNSMSFTSHHSKPVPLWSCLIWMYLNANIYFC